MGKILLPPNNGELNFSGDVGSWSDFTADFKRLGNILNKSEDDTIKITSIPSPWARMFLFRDAIYEEHPMHNQLMSEILDVLEMIFFQKNLYLDFNEKTINLSGPEKLFKGLKLYKPEEIKNEIKIIYCIDKNHHKYPIAATSPYSILFTPLDKKSKIAGRYLSKPKTISERPKIFLEYLKQYVLRNSAEIKENSLKNFFIYLGKITDAIPSTGNSDLDSNDIEEFITISGIKLFNLKEQHIESPLSISAEKDVTPKPLIIDEKIYNKKFYNGYSFLRKLNNKMLENYPRNYLPDELVEYPWICPKFDFFENKIYEVPFAVNTKDIISANFHVSVASEDNKDKYLLPLKIDYFKYFEVDSVRDNITLERSHNSIKAKMVIPVKSGEVEITKTYLPSNIIKIKEDKLIHFALWPKISKQLWKDDYFLLVYSEDIETYDLKLIYDIDNISLETQTTYKDGDEFKIFRLEDLPVGVNLLNKKHDASFDILFNKDSFLGTKYEEKRKAIVATDFGTSNTTVAFKINDEIKLMEFCDNEIVERFYNYKDFLYLYDIEPKVEQKPSLILFENILSTHFFPQSLCSKTKEIDKKPENPFMTILRVKDNDKSQEILRKGNIPFYLFDEPIKQGYSIKGDIKWSKDEELNYEARMFLKEIFLLIKLFAIKNRIDWEHNLNIYWAFPKSFSTSQRNLLNNIWEEFCSKNNFKKHVGYYESKASLAYFDYKGYLNPKKEQTYLSVDIGGGTSDISIRHQEKDIFNFSTPFGGNDLLGWECKYNQKDSILKNFLYNSLNQNSPNFVQILNDQWFKSLGRAHLEFNYLLLIAEKSLLKRIINETQNDPEKILILYFFGALFYELGIQISKIDKEHFSSKIEIYIGGNGLRFMYWLGGKWENEKYELPENITEYFKTILNEGINDEFFEDVKILFSEEPKSEVAIGLCNIDEINIKEPEFDYSISVGENVKYNGDILKYSESIKPLSTDKEFDSTKIELTGGNSTLISYNKLFIDELYKLSDSYLNINFQEKNFYNKLKDTMMDSTELEGYIRHQASNLYKKTKNLNASLFILGVKECIGKVSDLLSDIEL